MNDLASILKSVAPTLATAVLGPAGGAVVSALADKLGVPSDAVSVANALSSPEQLEKARQLELEWFKVEVQDKDSARKRESEISTSASAPWYSKIVTPLLAVIVTIAWFVIQWFLLNHVVPDAMREIIIRVLGNLDAAFMLVLSYYFGASHKHS